MIYTSFYTADPAENLPLLPTTFLVPRKAVQEIQSFHFVMNNCNSILYNGFIFLNTIRINQKTIIMI